MASCMGKGRYGVCFLAVDPHGKKVILKKFRRRMWKKNMANNYHESVILSGLAHEQIPQLLGVIRERKQYYFVLEYKEGDTLKDWLFEKNKIFNRTEIYRIGIQLFDILKYLRSRSVVHGDISIANVIDDGEHISLIDFGLARYAGDEDDFWLDYARAADVLLYLLYSGYPGKGKRPWYEELPLSSEQREFLRGLIEAGRSENGDFGEKKRQVENNITNIKKQFQEYFEKDCS